MKRRNFIQLSAAGSLAAGFSGSHDKVVGNDIKMNLCSKIKDKYVNSTRSLQGAG